MPPCNACTPWNGIGQVAMLWMSTVQSGVCHRLQQGTASRQHWPTSFADDTACSNRMLLRTWVAAEVPAHHATPSSSTSNCRITMHTGVVGSGMGAQLRHHSRSLLCSMAFELHGRRLCCCCNCHAVRLEEAIGQARHRVSKRVSHVQRGVGRDDTAVSKPSGSSVQVHDWPRPTPLLGFNFISATFVHVHCISMAHGNGQFLQTAHPPAPAAPYAYLHTALDP